MKVIANRLREPSTWAGVSMLMLAFGVPAGVGEALAQVGAGLAGLAAILMPERTVRP